MPDSVNPGNILPFSYVSCSTIPPFKYQVTYM